MTASALLSLLKQTPLVASVQASEGSPVDVHALTTMARASVEQGVRVLRLEGREAISAIRREVSVPTIGLIKRAMPGSEVYITPTSEEVLALLDLGCEVVALDGTARARPGGETLSDLIRLIHGCGRLAMADCDGMSSLRYALDAGADLVGTTLSGYTPDSPAQRGPDLDLLRAAVALNLAPVIAEGRYSEPWQAQAAWRIGAAAIVVGGALNDPVKQTRAFLAPLSSGTEDVGAVDIGGTWIRFAVFSPAGELLRQERAPLPREREERMEWIRDRATKQRVGRLGVSTGGTVDPSTGEVWEAKPIIPDHAGSRFTEELLGVPVAALNDGLATAWGHACHPRWAGKRVATLALGTGVGCGVVDRGRVLMGRRGEYPRMNDQPGPGGASYEDLLGGAALASLPSEAQFVAAKSAARAAALAVIDLYQPDAVVVCGGVGLAPWLRAERLLELETRTLPPIELSPYGENAGLYGAAALALTPPT